MSFPPPPQPPQFPYQPWPWPPPAAPPPPAPPPPLPYGQPPEPLQKERSRAGIVVAWLVIFACVGFIIFGRHLVIPDDKQAKHWTAGGDKVQSPTTAPKESANTRPATAPTVEPAGDEEEDSDDEAGDDLAEWLEPTNLPKPPNADFQLRLIGRYVVGAARFAALADAQQKGGGATTAPANSAAAQIKDMLPQVDEAARQSTADRMRAAIVAAEIGGADAGLARLEDLEGSLQNEGERHDAKLLRRIYRDGPDGLTWAQREGLVRRHGWFGQLSLVYGKPQTDEFRREVIAPAIRTALVGIGMVLLVGFGVLAGLVLLVVFLVQLGGGKWRWAYPRTVAPTGAFLEAFAAYLAAMVLVSLAIELWLNESPSSLWFIIVIVPCAFLWPLLRGVRRPELRQGLGWHKGRGWPREMGAGFLGYLAGLPLLAIGVIISAILQRLSGTDMQHPIVEEIGTGEGSRWGYLPLFLLAAAWAPVVEETMFRGAFYHHLRRRLAWPLAALVVGVIFAAIHPQGWAAIPLLTAIAFVFAALREWRGSIIASVTAHAINNGVVTTMVVLMVG